jgi:hypothetical protein
VATCRCGATWGRVWRFGAGGKREGGPPAGAGGYGPRAGCVGPPGLSCCGAGSRGLCPRQGVFRPFRPGKAGRLRRFGAASVRAVHRLVPVATGCVLGGAKSGADCRELRRSGAACGDGRSWLGAKTRGDSADSVPGPAQTPYFSGGHGTRTRNPLRGTSFPVKPLTIRLPSDGRRRHRP